MNTLITHIKKPLKILVAPLFLIWLAWMAGSTSDFLVDFVGAFLPTLVLVIYVVLDHLWKDDADDAPWSRLMRSLAYWNWKLTGGDSQTLKTQLALVLIVIVGISGVAQFRKARKETSDATSTKDQLAKSLTLASYSLTDIRILEKYIEDNGHWEQAILLAVASKISSNAVPSPAIVDLPPPALVLADASTDLRQWALQLQSEQASNQTQEAIHDALERQGLLKEQLETAREEEKRLESQQAFLKTILPVYDAIIAQFSSLVFSVRNEPSHKDEKFSTTCGRWPSDQLIISSSPAVCEISLGTNSAWHFVITIGHQGEISRDHPPALYIRDLNKVGTLYIVVNGETISASFTAPHSLPKTVSGFQTNFQQILQEPFHYFLGESIIESHELDYAPH